MQDGASWICLVRLLASLSAALFGLMMLIAGGLMPSAILIPHIEDPFYYLTLPSTWQVPAILICSLVGGPNSGVIAAISYLIVGLFHMPIFHDGGNLEYVFKPGFIYLVGFIPVAWMTGLISEKANIKSFTSCTYSAFIGLLLLQSFGLLSLSIGSWLGIWEESLIELLIGYSLVPFATQIILCPAVGIVSISLRWLILAE